MKIWKRFRASVIAGYWVFRELRRFRDVEISLQSKPLNTTSSANTVVLDVRFQHPSI